MTLRDAITRQHDIRRTPRRVTQPRQAIPQAPPGDEATFVLGKVIEVNVHSEDVRLAPLKSGVDPRDLVKWADDDNFDTDNAICCWTQGFPVCDIGWPGVAVLTQAGYVLVYQLQLELPHQEPSAAHAFCPPDGISAPQIPADCDPLPDPGICTTKFACCLTGEVCNELTEIECAAAGGMYYGPGTELGGDDGRHCVGTGDGDVTCEPLLACVNPVTVQCQDLPASDCPAGNNHYPCTCAEWFANPVGRCP
jgi:hypothetical protein